jgi:4-oxalocrotonate tautomerase
MPIITLEGPRIEDMDKRRAFVRVLTEAAVQAYDLPASTMIVILHEVPQECVGSGGELISDRPAP